MKHATRSALLAILTLLPVSAEPKGNVPGDKAVPPSDIFGGEITYDLTDMTAKDVGHVRGTPVTIEKGTEHTSVVVSLEKPVLGILLINYCESPEVAKASFDKGRKDIKAKGMADLSEITEDKHFTYCTTIVFGSRHACSGLVGNIHFLLNEPGGYHDKAWVMKQAKAYADHVHQAANGGAGADEEPALPKKTEWKGANGKVIKGRIIQVDPIAKTVTLERTDGKVFKNLPLDKFAPEEHETILNPSE